MSKYSIILTVCLLFVSKILYGYDWNYDQNYQRERLYLHVVTNYAYDHRWNYKWEKNYLKSNSMRMNYGSVTTSELLTDIQLVINQEIGPGWHFKTRLNRSRSLHKNHDTFENFM